MAGQHLLDQRCAGAGEAEDEHRPAGGQSGTDVRAKNSGTKACEQAIDELLVLGRDVLAFLLAGQFQGQGIGLPQAVRRHGRNRRGRRAHGQGEQQPGAGTVCQLRVGKTFFERGQVGVGQLAAQQRRQTGVRQGKSRLQAQRFPKGGSASASSPILLVQSAQAHAGRREIGCSRSAVR